MYCRVVNGTTATAASARSAGSSVRRARQLRQALTSATPGMVCDVANPEHATNFTWTGTTITYSGAPLTAVPVSIINPTPTATFTNSTTGIVAVPTFSGAPAPANELVTIATTSGCLAVDNTLNPMYSASPCTGTSTTEQFVLQPVNGSTTVERIMPGEQTIIKSVETGMYCRLATFDDGQQGVLCDVSSISQATPLTYTGTGLAYGGQPLAAGGAGQPLLVTPGATSSTSTLTVYPVGPPASPGECFGLGLCDA